jgi:hypothetical protein
LDIFQEREAKLRAVIIIALSRAGQGNSRWAILGAGI